MRGTLHLLPAADYPLWQAALSTRRGHERGAWLRYFGVSRSELETVLEAISAALDGPPLTREALAAAIARETGSPALGQKMLGSWGSLLKPAAFQGRLCFGPNQGPNVCFTRPDRWLAGAGRTAGRPAPLDPDAARREVTRRYLATYGPATREDLGRWWGETPPRAGAMLAALGDEIVPVEIAGGPPGAGPAWALAGDVDAPPRRRLSPERLPPARLRSVRRHRPAQGVPGDSRRRHAPRLPPPGLALPRPAGGREDRRHLAPRAPRRPPGSDRRALRGPPGADQEGGRRRGGAPRRLHRRDARPDLAAGVGGRARRPDRAGHRNGGRGRAVGVPARPAPAPAA